MNNKIRTVYSLIISLLLLVPVFLSEPAAEGNGLFVPSPDESLIRDHISVSVTVNDDSDSTLLSEGFVRDPTSKSFNSAGLIILAESLQSVDKQPGARSAVSWTSQSSSSVMYYQTDSSSKSDERSPESAFTVAANNENIGSQDSLQFTVSDGFANMTQNLSLTVNEVGQEGGLSETNSIIIDVGAAANANTMLNETGANSTTATPTVSKNETVPSISAQDGNESNLPSAAIPTSIVHPDTSTASDTGRNDPTELTAAPIFDTEYDSSHLFFDIIGVSVPIPALANNTDVNDNLSESINLGQAPVQPNTNPQAPVENGTLDIGFSIANSGSQNESSFITPFIDPRNASLTDLRNDTVTSSQEREHEVSDNFTQPISQDASTDMDNSTLSISQANHDPVVVSAPVQIPSKESSGHDNDKDHKHKVKENDKDDNNNSSNEGEQPEKEYSDPQNDNDNSCHQDSPEHDSDKSAADTHHDNEQENENNDGDQNEGQD